MLCRQHGFEVHIGQKKGVGMSEVTAEKLLSDFQVLIDDAEQLVRATADEASERVAQVRQRLVLNIEESKKALAQCQRELREQAEQAKSRAIGFLREESWSRLILAAVIGTLIGLALRRNRHRTKEPEMLIK